MSELGALTRVLGELGLAVIPSEEINPRKINAQG